MLVASAYDDDSCCQWRIAKLLSAASGRLLMFIAARIALSMRI